MEVPISPRNTTATTTTVPTAGNGLGYPSIQTVLIFAHTQKGAQQTVPTVGEAQAVQQKVAAAVQEDIACRRPGVTEGLYPLEGLAPFSRLGHGIPMIRKASPVEFGRAADNGEFHDRLHRFAPYLANLDMKGLGLRLAGGAVSALVMQSSDEAIRSDGASETDHSACHDFDLFLVGHKSDESALEAINILARHLREQWVHSEMKVYRTQGCITFYTPWLKEDPEKEKKPTNWERCPYHGYGCPVYDPNHPDTPHYSMRRRDCLVQVILRRYSTDAEVIHGFDLGSSAFLWDGKQVLMTGLGRLAAEHGINVLNLDARRGSYERRLARYFKRGFDLVLPDLNNCGLASLEGRLPYLYAEKLVNGGCACGLTAENLWATRPGYGNDGRPILPEDKKAAREDEGASDYSAAGFAYGNVRVLTSRNMRALGEKEIRVVNLCASAEYKGGLDIAALEPTLELETVNELIAWALGQYCGKVNLKMLRAILGPDRTVELVLEYISAGEIPDRDTVRRYANDRCRELNRRAHIPFAFMRVEEKTALTGPFPRELVTKADWYGGAMRFV
jgi:hypothetical protein